MKKHLLVCSLFLLSALTAQVKAQSCFDMTQLPASGQDYQFGVKDPSTDPQTFGWLLSAPVDPSERRTIMSAGDVDTLFTSLSVVPQGKDHSLRLASPNYAYADNVPSNGGDVRFEYAVTADNAILLISYAAGLQEPNNTDAAAALPRYGQPWCSFYVLDANGTLLQNKAVEHYSARPTTLVGWNLVNTAHGQAYVKDWSTVGIDLTNEIGTTVTVVLSYHDEAIENWDAATGTVTVCRTKHKAHVYAYLDCTKKELTLDCAANILTAPEGFDYTWRNQDGTPTGTTTRTFSLPATRTENLRYSCELTGSINCLEEDFTIDTLIFANSTQASNTICESQLPWTDMAGGHQFTREEMDLTGTRSHTHTYPAVANGNGCDSVMAFTLNIFPTKIMPTIDTVVCEDELPFTWKGITWHSADSTVVDTIPTDHGDSVVTFHFKTKSCECFEFKGTLQVDNPICANTKGFNAVLKAWQGRAESYTLTWHMQDPNGHFYNLSDNLSVAAKEQEFYIPFMTGRIQPAISDPMTTA